MKTPLTVAVAQLNCVVGDLSGNARRILDAVTQAKAAGADVVLTPELALCGYPPEDLLLRPAFLQACADELAALAVQVQGVEGTRLDKTFHSPAVQLSAVHPLTEIIEVRIRLFFSLFHDSLDEVAAHILDRIQAETDLAVVRREAAVRDIDVRRKHLDAQAGALARILDDFVGIVKHTGEQCGHKLAGVMTLEISRLECDVSVADRKSVV